MPTLRENFYKNNGLSIFVEGEGYDDGLAGEMEPKTYYNMFSPAKEKLIKKVSDFAKKTVADKGRVTIMFSDGREYPINSVSNPEKINFLTKEMNDSIMNKDREALTDHVTIFFKAPVSTRKQIRLKMPEFVKFVELYIQP